LIRPSFVSRDPSAPPRKDSVAGARDRALRLLAGFLLIATFVALRQGSSTAGPPRSVPSTWEAGPSSTQELLETHGGGWWSERKKRFQELAICALSSANVTYILIAGFTGPGAVIGFLVSVVGFAACL
jgi:hypothetical protein